MPFYHCTDCGFTFKREKKPETCPDCGKPLVRDALQQEIEEVKEFQRESPSPKKS